MSTPSAAARTADIPVPRGRHFVKQAVIGTDVCGTINFWNAAAETMYGWSRAQALGKPLAELHIGAQPRSEAEEILAWVLSGNTWTGEYLVARRDGSTFPALVTNAPFLDVDGSVLGVIGVSTDLSDHRAAQEALRNSEDLFRKRFTDAPIPQAMIRPDGTFEQVNPAMARITQLPPEMMAGRAVLDFVHPDDASSVHEWFLALLAGKDVPASATWRYMTARGEIRWGLTSLMVVRNEAGDPLHVASFVQDVTAEKAAGAEREQALTALRQSEERFRALVHRSADAALVIDEKAIISYASPAILTVLGHHPEDLVGRDGLDFVHPDDVDEAKQILAAVLETPGPHPPFTIRLRAADGTYVITEEAVTNSMKDPAIGGLILNLRDVSERVAAERARTVAEHRYRSIVETAEEGIWLLDEEGRTTFVNPRLTTMLGRPAEALMGRIPTDFAHPDDDADLAAQIRSRLAGRAGRYEIRLLRGDGTPIWVLVSAHVLTDDEGNRLGSQAMITDITDRRLMEEQLRHNALHDELTGLPNRTLLRDRMEQIVRRSKRQQSMGAVLFVDLDDFKLVNDSLGHAAGDEFLIEVSRRLATAVRAQDTIARFGGDEFVILAEELTDEAEARVIAARVLTAVSESWKVGGTQLSITASIGIAYTTAGGADELLRNADAAMYRAKEQGRGRIETYDDRTQHRAPRELKLASDLRAALRGDTGLVLHYQPIVDTGTGRPVGAEALVRWHHPDEGLLQPADFIALAERNDLICDLDRWVLEHACVQAAEWMQAERVDAGFTIAVNISARHVSEASLVESVRSALAAAGLPAHRLTVEITETAVVGDADRVTGNLAALRLMGVSVALDDFGTGYSSLTFLKSLPADILKIDRSFIAGIGSGPRDRAIAANLISLARDLGLECVAEGVETNDQLLALQQWKCPRAQGYLWSPPVTAEAFCAQR